MRMRNYRENNRCDAPKAGEMINGQALGSVAKLRYGACFMSHNGCEVIAVCNALTYAGKPRDIREIAAYMERYRVLMGFFGSSVYHIGKALSHFGLDNRIVPVEQTGDAFILSSWTGRSLFSSVHTVFGIRENGRIKVYNRYNSCGEARFYDSPADIFSGRTPLRAYNILQEDSIWAECSEKTV